MTWRVEQRVGGRGVVALETTVFTHGLPRTLGPTLIAELRQICRDEGAVPAFTGVIAGVATVGLNDDELHALLEREDTTKVNTANFGLTMFEGRHGATTVSTTLELAARSGIAWAATGGLGGVHRGLPTVVDVSSDLAALARFPVAIVSSGFKSILDVSASRELLESVGVPVVGYQTTDLPLFLSRSSGLSLDARIDDVDRLAAFASAEVIRSDRGVCIVQPVPKEVALEREALETALSNGPGATLDAEGRDATPNALRNLREAIGPAMVEANVTLLKENVRLAARLAARVKLGKRRATDR